MPRPPILNYIRNRCLHNRNIRRLHCRSPEFLNEAAMMERATLRPLLRRIPAAVLRIRYPHRLVVVYDLVSVDGDRVDIFKTVCGRRSKSARAQLPATRTARAVSTNHTQPALHSPPSPQPTFRLPLPSNPSSPSPPKLQKKKKGGAKTYPSTPTPPAP